MQTMLEIHRMLRKLPRARVGVYCKIAADGHEVTIKRDTLAALRDLRKRELVAWLSRRALHVRWSTGGLNLLSRSVGKSDRVYVLQCA